MLAKKISKFDNIKENLFFAMLHSYFVGTKEEE
jgi:hypothetical protein